MKSKTRKKMLGFGNKIEEIKIDKSNIDSFVPIETLRAIRKTQVTRLERAFLDGSYIKSALIHVNQKGSEFIIIDGSHRISAIKNLIEADKVKEVSVNVAVYSNLSSQKERDLYDLIAKQVPQNTNDFLSLHRVEFPLWNIIEKKSYPCKVSIYGSKESIQFKTFLHMLNSVKRKKFDAQNLSIGRDKLLVTGQKTNEDHYYLIREFIGIFMAAYGAPGTANKFSKIHIVTPLFHIWYWNRNNFAKIQGREQATMTKSMNWVKRFEKIMSDPEIVLHLHSTATREILPRIRQRMIELMQPQRDNKQTKFKLI